MWIGRKLSREDSRDTIILFKKNGSLGRGEGDSTKTEASRVMLVIGLGRFVPGSDSADLEPYALPKILSRACLTNCFLTFGRRI